jgi:RHS repeat-associated protein
VGETGTASSGINTFGGLEAGGWGDGSNDNSDPRVFVNIVIFDKNYKFMDVAYAQLTSNGALMTASYTVKEAGYAYLYVSNENPTLVDVYFDDVKMSYTPGNIIQSNEYYAHGLPTSNSWTRDNAVGNNFLANGGTELNATSSLYDLNFRNYDPVLGRLNQVDPLTDKYSSHSSYHFSFNNPIRFNDPSGADPLWGLYERAEYISAMMGRDQAYAHGGGGPKYDGSGGYYMDTNGNGVQDSGEMNVTYEQTKQYYGSALSVTTAYSSQPQSDTDVPTGKLIALFLDQTENGNFYLKLVFETANTSMVSSTDPKDNIGARFLDDASFYLGGNRWGANGTVDGVSINNSDVRDLKYGAAFTTPWSGINLSYDFYGSRTGLLKDLVRHEFGHILQYRRYGAAFYGVMAATSVVSAWASDSEAQHQRSWSESEANTLSYMFFGFPVDWNRGAYPINADYMDAVIKTDFTKDFPGLGN